MCFKNLPVVFDEAGKAHLREGINDPFVYKPAPTTEERQQRIEGLLARNGHIKEISIDPVTRVAGALAFHSVVDL
ncbi:MAG: cytochrome C, partial [Chloroflexi bacterium]|nr:cytochrome C [Chloroflexota bacterium]